VITGSSPVLLTVAASTAGTDTSKTVDTESRAIKSRTGLLI
jgi:hypothetical protein